MRWEKGWRDIKKEVIVRGGQREKSERDENA